MRLSRGLTPAIIQDVCFSGCGTLLTVSSARGTTHVYRLALPGKPVSLSLLAPGLCCAIACAARGLARSALYLPW